MTGGPVAVVTVYPDLIVITPLTDGNESELKAGDVLYTEAQALAMYAAGAEAMRERADDAWADAIQSDCEGGVSFLSEMSANVLHKQFPCLAKLGETIRAIPITKHDTQPTKKGSN